MSSSEAGKSEVSACGSDEFTLDITRWLHVPVTNPGAIHQTVDEKESKDSRVGINSCLVKIVSVGELIKS